MNIKNGILSIIVFTNKYGYYTCIRTPVDKEKTDFYKKYINVRFMDSAIGKIKVINGDILIIKDGWFSVWNENLYLNINEFVKDGNIERGKRNGNEKRTR